ncbi:hypothetical protein FRC12_016563 [Ceratobasidium sp. 428]|nr:hypothetical protein FRC12_016563 [Ceratobasidium sp. 428]
MECIYPGYPHTILRCPCVRGFPIKNTVRRRLAAYFRTNVNSQRTFHEWMQYLPERCERWGKVRIADRGDRIRCAATTNPLSPYGKRDASFVKYIYQRDKNERYKHKKIELVPAIGYISKNLGRLGVL